MPQQPSSGPLRLRREARLLATFLAVLSTFSTNSGTLTITL